MKIRDTQVDDKLINKDNPRHRILSMLELETEILALKHQFSREKLQPALGMSLLVQNKRLFHRRRGAWPILKFKWPHGGELVTIEVRANARTSSNGAVDGVYTLDFRINNQRLMALTSRGTRDLYVALPDEPRPHSWSLIAIHEIVDVFNTMFQARNISYGDLGGVMVGGRIPAEVKYNGEDFTRLMTKYNKYKLTCRLNNSIVAYVPEQGNVFKFKMDWLDKSKINHKLNITFVRGQKFEDTHSRFLSEKNLLDLVPAYKEVPSGQLYYSIKVDELVRHPDTWSTTNVRSENFTEMPLLSMWFTLDGLIGELKNIQAGDKINGNEVLRIYQHFAKLLKIDNVFICDDSTLPITEAHTKIALRMISALATGKTWFEKMPGVKLFESSNLRIGHYDSVKQSSYTRNTSLQELQNLPLARWYTMLSASRKKVLYGLCEFYWPRKQPVLFVRGASTAEPSAAHFKDATLKTLAAKVYNEAKKQGQGTLELSKLNDLLCGNGGLAIDNAKPVVSANDDSWVRSRVYELLWGSYVWRQKGNLEESTPDVKRLLH